MLGIAEGAGARHIGGLGAHEQLVPCAESRAGAIGDNRQFRLEVPLVLPLSKACHQAEGVCRAGQFQ